MTFIILTGSSTNTKFLFEKGRLILIEIYVPMAKYSVMLMLTMNALVAI